MACGPRLGEARLPGFSIRTATRCPSRNTKVGEGLSAALELEPQPELHLALLYLAGCRCSECSERLDVQALGRDGSGILKDQRRHPAHRCAYQERPLRYRRVIYPIR